MKNFKFALSGFVMGILVSFGFSFADEGTYTLTKMDAKIFVEGSERKIDEPILNLNGRAYLPLRKFGEISRGEISWEPTTKVISYKPFQKIINGYKYYDKNGASFMGFEKEDGSQSAGTLKTEKGDIYTGLLKNYKFDDIGRYISANGDIYIGSWKDGKMSDLGTLYNKDGSISVYVEDKSKNTNTIFSITAYGISAVTKKDGKEISKIFYFPKE